MALRELAKSPPHLDAPFALYPVSVLKPLKAAGINVHYLYPHLGHIDGQAIVILGVDRTEEAQQVLAENWVTTLGPEVANA